MLLPAMSDKADSGHHNDSAGSFTLPKLPPDVDDVVVVAVGEGCRCHRASTLVTMATLSELKKPTESCKTHNCHTRRAKSIVKIMNCFQSKESLFIDKLRY